MSFLNRMRIGMDIGSTTVKVVVVSQKGEILFSQYKRHFSEIKETYTLDTKLQTKVY